MLKNPGTRSSQRINIFQESEASFVLNPAKDQFSMRLLWSLEAFEVSTVSIVFPSICHKVMGPDAMLSTFSWIQHSVFWMLSFKPIFSLSSFTFFKSLFSSSLSAIRVVTSAHLRLLIFFLAILIPACVSSSPAFHMMYSAYKLNKQGDNIQPWRTPFLVWNQCVVPCPCTCLEPTVYLLGGSLDAGMLSFLF